MHEGRNPGGGFVFASPAGAKMKYVYNNGLCPKLSVSLHGGPFYVLQPVATISAFWAKTLNSQDDPQPHKDINIIGTVLMETASHQGPPSRSKLAANGQEFQGQYWKNLLLLELQHMGENEGIKCCSIPRWVQ